MVFEASQWIRATEKGDAVFHVTHLGDIENTSEQIGYFQDDALQKSDISGLYSEHTIE